MSLSCYFSCIGFHLGRGEGAAERTVEDAGFDVLSRAQAASHEQDQVQGPALN